MVVIYRSAVIGINQTKVPQLIPLIHIWHARRGEFQEGLCERIVHAVLRDLMTQLLEILTNEQIIKHDADKLPHRVIIGLIRINPTRIDLGLL